MRSDKTGTAGCGTVSYMRFILLAGLGASLFLSLGTIAAAQASTVQGIVRGVNGAAVASAALTLSPAVAGEAPRKHGVPATALRFR